MTTSTVRKGQAASAKTEAGKATETTVKPVTRREFLYYIWGASMAVLLAQSAGAIIWFALPRFREGEYGGIFPISPSEQPAVASPPVDNPEGKFWLANTPEGVLALSKVCTHLGCLFKWVDANNRFECPCHGSKFEPDGTYIEGPAPRSLDRFAVNVVTPSGTVREDEGNPVQTDGATRIEVDTGKKIKGPSNA